MEKIFDFTRPEIEKKNIKLKSESPFSERRKIFRSLIPIEGVRSRMRQVSPLLCDILGYKYGSKDKEAISVEDEKE